MEIDKLNKRILQLLQRDGRITYKDITKEMDRAESTVRERISFMEEQGIIEGYTAIINKPRVGLNCSAIVYSRVQPTQFDEVANKLKLVNGVLQIYHTSGEKNMTFFITASERRAEPHHHDENHRCRRYGYLHHHESRVRLPRSTS
jgi:Lrp/AsnC family transcriptional regulator for asnA, asnC and gidA